jgi:hypothetical protein
MFYIKYILRKDNPESFKLAYSNWKQRKNLYEGI